ncbi:MAG: single-stranded-DNA-specific exonuclease RecJ [Actinobacteria bacterium]|nr:MAG: single-stranded-DNA-specific exonuclease RecJ [Actinomycetota bacterium]
MAVPDSATPERAFRLEPYSYPEVRALMEALGLAEPVAMTLVRRGHRTVDEARAFLEATEVHDPFEFGSMEEVTERIRDAIVHGRTITVHGDYDCDGVCSTAILVRALREMGASCDWYVPDRLGDGYGLTIGGVERLAARGTGLLLTADCGITSAGEVAAARAAGMEVIVTDHHEPGELLPDCPLLHPRLSSYPCGELCATGVAYKLSAALLGAERAADDLDLVALATVADLVPLQGENRALVRAGLGVARQARRPGLRALCAVAGVGPERLDEGDLAFRLGPRINAAGRLYRADAGVELMLTADDQRAAAIAAELDRVNRERRDTERLVLSAAEQARTALPAELASAPALVLAGEGWHPGVVGIVASRLAERHFVPVVLIGMDGEGRGRGSGRSIPGFDLLAALDACGEHLLRYGGHRAAAGLEIEAGRVEDFRAAFAAKASAALGERDLIHTEVIDAVVGGESLGHEVAEQLGRLAPFGIGNPGVRLLVPSARLCEVRPMGEGERHARFRLQSGSRSALGVAFGVNGELGAAELADPVDVSVKLELNEWHGAVEPRVVLGELYPAGSAMEAKEPRYPTTLSSRRRSTIGRRGRSPTPLRGRIARSWIGGAAREWPRLPRWRPAAARCWPCARMRFAVATWLSAPPHRSGSAADGSRSPRGGSPTTPLAPPSRSWARRAAAWPWPTGRPSPGCPRCPPASSTSSSSTRLPSDTSSAWRGRREAPAGGAGPASSTWPGGRPRSSWRCESTRTNGPCARPWWRYTGR